MNHDLKHRVRRNLPPFPTRRLEFLDLGRDLVGAMSETPASVGEAGLDLVRARLGKEPEVTGTVEKLVAAVESVGVGGLAAAQTR